MSLGVFGSFQSFIYLKEDYVLLELSCQPFPNVYMSMFIFSLHLVKFPLILLFQVYSFEFLFFISLG